MSYRPPGYQIPNQPYSQRYGSNLYLPANVGPARAMIDAGQGGGLRQAMKRCFNNISKATAASDFYNVRMFNMSFEPMDRIQIGIPHWFDGGPETACTGTLTARAYFQWVGGPLTTLTFNGGNPVGTIAAGNVLTDDLTLHTDLCVIPRGVGPCFLNFYLTSTTGQFPFSPFNQGGGASVALGDAVAIGANVAQNGAFADGGIAGSFFLWPAYIAGLVSSKSPALIGDSRGCTETATVITANGDMGEIGRAIGGQTPYLNVCRAGQTSQSYLTSNFQRSLLIKKFCTRIIYNLSINDFPGTTGAQAYADMLAVKALYPGMPFYNSTISPNSTSSDSWATVANQTTTAKNTTRVDYNTLARANAGGADAVFDICQYTESSLNSGKWAVNGVANYPTTDGLHGSTALNQTIVVNLPP